MGKVIRIDIKDAKKDMIRALEDPETTGVFLVFKKGQVLGAISHEDLKQKPFFMYQVESFIQTIFQHFIPE